MQSGSKDIEAGRYQRGGIVDAAVHIWSNDPVAYPWEPKDGVEIPDRAGTRELLLERLDRFGVAGAVCVQSRAYGGDHSYLVDAVAAAPDRIRGVGLVNPVGRSGADDLRRLFDSGMTGFRVVAVDSCEAGWLDGPDGDPLWEAARKLGAVAGVLCRPDQLSMLGRRLRSVETPVVVDHLGLIARRSPELDVLLHLTEFSNVLVRVSALLHLASTSSDDEVAAVVDDVVTAFGPDRLLFGTDWPYCLEFGDWTESIAMLARPAGEPALDLAHAGVVARKLFWGES